MTFMTLTFLKLHSQLLTLWILSITGADFITENLTDAVSPSM